MLTTEYTEDTEMKRFRAGREVNKEGLLIF